MDSTLILVLLFSALIGYGIAVLLYFYNLKDLFKQLERNYPSYWEALNKPQLTAQGLPVQSTGRLFLFLIRKEYLKIDDQYIIAVGSKTRRYLIAGLGLFGLLILVCCLLPFT